MKAPRVNSSRTRPLKAHSSGHQARHIRKCIKIYRKSTFLGPRWTLLGPSRGHLGAILSYLGALRASFLQLSPGTPSWTPSWRHLGAILAQFGAILGHLGAILGHLGAILAPSWRQVRPSCRHFGHPAPVQNWQKSAKTAAKTMFMPRSLPRPPRPPPDLDFYRFWTHFRTHF